MLDGPALEWSHGPCSRARRGPAPAAVLGVREHARLTETQQAGRRSRGRDRPVIPSQRGNSALSRASPSAVSASGLSTSTHCLPVRVQWSLTRQ